MHRLKPSKNPIATRVASQLTTELLFAVERDATESLGWCGKVQRRSERLRLLTKATGLPIGKCALDLSGQNSVVCTPRPAAMVIEELDTCFIAKDSAGQKLEGGHEVARAGFPG
jgi:hypothetical protein